MHPNAVEVRRAWNAKHWRDPDGTLNGVFSTGAIHYRSNPSGEWLDKRQSFKVGSGAKGPLHFVSDESDVVMETYQRGSGGSRRWTIEFVEKITGNGIRFLLRVQPSIVAGSPTLSFSDGQGGEWTYTHTRAGGKLIGPPITTRRGAFTYTFEYELIGNAPALTLNADGSISCGDIFRMARAVVEGADYEMYPASAWTIGAGTLSFSYDDTALPAAALPYRVDPSTAFSVAVGGDDARQGLFEPVYPPAASRDSSSSSTALFAQRNWNGTNYQVFNGYARWDTSSLLDNSGVLGATLSLWATQTTLFDADLLAYVMDWYTAWLGGVPGLEHHVHTPPEPTALRAKRLDTFTLGGNNDLTLENAATNINKTGYSGIRMHVTQRAGDAAPVGKNEILFASFDNTAAEPILTVTYSDDVVPPAAPTGLLPPVVVTY